MIARNVIAHKVEEIEMGKRNNLGEDAGGYAGFDVGTNRRGRGSDRSSGSGGGRVLVVLIMLVGGFFAVLALVGHLGSYVPATAAAGAELSMGTWAVAGLLGLFLAWCFFSGSKGGRR